MARELRLAIVLPRNMNFGPDGATAIDLCTYDFVKNSRYRKSIRTFIRPIDQPFADVEIEQCDRQKRTPLFSRRTGFEAAIAQFDPDVILVEQHIPSATAINRRFPNTPVLIRRHGYVKPSKNPIRNTIIKARLKRFSKIVAVSDSVANDLTKKFPSLSPSTVTVHNGIDCNAWRPNQTKRNLISFAGRAVPEKGGLEALEGTLRFLTQYPDWQSIFVFSTSDSNADYVRNLRQMKDSSGVYGAQLELRFDVAHDEVRETFEESKIVIVPSIWNEPFGRTAIEAMSAGALLITSATGGLKEIARQDNSYILDVVSPDAVYSALDESAKNVVNLAIRAAKGRETVISEFSIQAVTNKLDDVIGRVFQDQDPSLVGEANV